MRIRDRERSATRPLRELNTFNIYSEELKNESLDGMDGVIPGEERITSLNVQMIK